MEQEYACFRTRLARLVKSLSIRLAGMPGQGIHVFYGHNYLPSSSEVAHGGIVKFQRLNEIFPNTLRRFNILYMVSSNSHVDAEHIFRAARRKGAKLVWNQNGVAYPAWMPAGWKEANERASAFLHSADYVFYQSGFCRSSSDHFLGKRSGPSEILYNAVDTDIFRPISGKNKKLTDEIVLLTAGSKYFFHRIESPIRTLACVRRYLPRARLIFAGKIKETLVEPTRKLISDLALGDHISFLPPFTQEEAPVIFQPCDILIHPKILDPCPGVVIEAMSCGLPIVFSDSGGVPELVGKEAGIEVSTKLSWDRFIPPEPEKWAEAVVSVVEAYNSYSEAARQRAVDRFDLRPWVERHRQVFFQLLEN